ncbi:hypothetical protein Bca4012_006135 [Brassica carinata]
MNSDLPSLPASLVGGRVRPRCLFADPFSSPAASHREVPEAHNEAVPMAPSKQRCSYVLDDGPCSEIQEEDLMAIRRRYAIHSSVQMSSSSEFKRASDGEPNEMAVIEAYLVAGFRGSFCHSWLTPLSWRTLMPIQVLGELYGLDIGIHEVLYSYYFAPLTIMPGFYHLQPRDGTPLVEEPSRDVARPVSFLGEAVAKQVLAISRCFRRVPFLDEYQQAGTRRRRSFYTPPPRLARATPPTARFRPDSVRTPTGGVPLMGIQQRLLTELFLLRNRVRDMAAQCDLLIRQVRDSARWELMKEWLERRTEHWDPEEEYRQHLLRSEGLDRHSGGFSQVSLRSVAESRVSAGPPF